MTPSKAVSVCLRCQSPGLFPYLFSSKYQQIYYRAFLVAVGVFVFVLAFVLVVVVVLLLLQKPLMKLLNKPQSFVAVVAAAVLSFRPVLPVPLLFPVLLCRLAYCYFA
jgi:hypothetical protein